jgi:putative sporulation protein YyaC
MPMHATRVRFDAPGAAAVLGSALRALFRAWPSPRPGFLCIGTDRLTGDSFGPLVGSILAGLGLDVPVAGTLACPVHAENLAARARELAERGCRPLVAVDACVGSEPGVLEVAWDALRPRFGDLPAVGEICLKGTVLVPPQKKSVLSGLGSVRLWLVLRMACVAALAVAHALDAPGSPAAPLGQAFALLPLPCEEPAGSRR